MVDEKKPEPAAPVVPDPGWPEQKIKTPPMAKEPQVAPDGHVNLSKEDIDARV